MEMERMELRLETSLKQQLTKIKLETGINISQWVKSLIIANINKLPEYAIATKLETELHENTMKRRENLRQIGAILNFKSQFGAMLAKAHTKEDQQTLIQEYIEYLSSELAKSKHAGIKKMLNTRISFVGHLLNKTAHENCWIEDKTIE